MTNKEILQIAMEQSALDINCNAEDFLCDHPVIVKSGVGPKRGNIIRSRLPAIWFPTAAFVDGLNQ